MSQIMFNLRLIEVTYLLIYYFISHTEPRKDFKEYIQRPKRDLILRRKYSSVDLRYLSSYLSPNFQSPFKCGFERKIGGTWTPDLPWIVVLLLVFTDLRL